MSLLPTPSQTVGPYFAIGLTWPDGPFAVPSGAAGQGVWIRGRVLDGAGEPVIDALVETWRPPAPGQAGAERIGFARSAADATGAWEVLTAAPALPTGAEGAPEAPHLAVSVFARGLLRRLVTRIYFAGFEDANAADPVLVSVPAARRETLIAQRTDDDAYRFDIHLQGPSETVFFIL